MALWDKINSRGNVDDRRSSSGYIGGGLGVAGIAILLLFNYLNGGSVGDAINQIQNIEIQKNQSQNASDFEGQDSYEVFASTVLGSTNDMWGKVFIAAGKTYTAPTLVLFRGSTNSSCGGADSRVGPHYCPIDQTIYLDETFFEELTSRLGAAGGDVAEAYVIAHEVGHHVQYEDTGLHENINNEESVALELQADCYAGLWAYSIKDLGVFLPQEINEALDAAAAVGDDRIQKKTEGSVHPETWTHGSSAARVAAFNRGYETGLVKNCSL